MKSQSSSKASKDISQRLKDEEFVLLTSSSPEETINKILTVYKSLPENTGKNLSNVDLFDMCNETVKKDGDNDDYYKRSRRFCVVPKTVADSPKLKGKTILKNETTSEEDKNDWESLKAKYTVSSNAQKRIKGLDSLTGGAAGEEWKKLRDGCKSLLGEDTTEEGYDDLVEKALTWCIKNSSGLQLADQ